MGPRFVGRAAELDELVRLLDAALDGQARLAVLSGEPGIGKTRLASELTALAGVRAVPVLWGPCTDEDGAPAFWPWRRALRAWAALLGPEAAAAALTGQTAALARIAPELPAVPEPSGDGPEDRFALFEAAASALAAIAAPAGLVVVLDDVQWADPASLRLLRHVAREAGPARLLLVVTLRPSELAADASRVVADLVRMPGAVALELGGLDGGEVGAALAERLGEPPGPDLVAAIHARTGGNPFFVGELARLMAAGEGVRIPVAVRDVVRRRLEPLPVGCRALLGPAAVLGREIDPARLAAVAAAPVEEVLGRLRPALDDGVLDRPGGRPGLRFAHDLVRETVLDDLDPATRARAHLAAADTLAERAGDDPDPDALAELAHHALAALPFGDPAAAVSWARRAATVALDRLAFEDAARLLVRAAEAGRAVLPVVERIAVLLDAARAQAWAHDVAGAQATCSEVVGLARAAGDPAAVGRAALVLDGVSDLDWLATARGWCREALHGLGERDGPLRARLLAQLAHALLVVGEDGHRLSADALAVAEAADDDAALVAALRARQLASAGPSGNRERLILGGRMLEVARRSGDAATAVWGHLWRFDALLQAGRTEAAEAELGPLEAEVVRSRQPIARLHLLRSRAAVCFCRGQFGEAEQLNQEARRMGERSGHDGVLMTSHAIAFHLGMLLGRDGLAVEAPSYAMKDRSPHSALLRLTVAAWHLALGRRAEAARWSEGLPDPGSARVPGFMLLVSAALRATLAAELGDGTAAAAVYRVLTPHADLHVVGGAGALASHGSVHLYLGLAADRADVAIGHFRTAVAANDAAGAVPFAAMARYRLARALQARGRPADEPEATAAALAAAETAAELGMAPLAAQVAALRRGPVGGLSRREAEIAELVGRGLTNRQIAATAHISERTVETHVQHVMAKLGFGRRAEIAAWVARSGQ